MKEYMGKTNWIAQRVTGIYVLMFIAYVFAWFLIESPTTFEHWELFLNDQVFQILATIFTLTIIYHSWLGIWTIVTDYAADAHEDNILRLSQAVHLFYLLWMLELIWRWP